MKIAVTSQNFRTITGHAGKARRFLVYEVEAGSDTIEVERIDLPMGMAFHDFHGDGQHPIDGVDVVITGSCGAGFAHRLAARGIRVLTTGETDPAIATRKVAADEPLAAPQPHEHHH